MSDHDSQHIRITHHFDERFMDLLDSCFQSFNRQLNHKLDQLKEIIMASNAELQQQLTDLGTQVGDISTEVDKIGTETDGLQAKVAELETAIANQGNTTPEVDAALQAVKDGVANLKAKVKVVDDKVADAAPTP